MDGTTTTTGGAGEEQRAPDARAVAQPQLVATALGDQCANCGARLAGDQRYCLECGERRGKPRYSLPGAATGAAVAPASARGARRLRMTSSSTLIAGVATLLLAMGVGVLIGRTSNGTSPRNSGVQVVTLPGAGGAAAAGATPTTSSTSSTSASSKSKSKTKSKSSPRSPKAALAAKLPPKARVIPKKLKSAVEKVGGKCTAGSKGCTNGKFTGTFFGGG